MPLPKDPRDSRAWRELRKRILARDGYTCHYCGQPADTVDHILPVSKHPDQAMSPDNCVSACRTCNSRKGSRSQGSFLAQTFAPPVFPAYSLPETRVAQPASPFSKP
jgi:5-methylcytosine-specific restriction endonuclease McrA